MPDNRPGPPDRKLTLIAPIVIGGIVVVLLAATLLLRGPKQPVVQPPPPPAPTAAQPPVVTLPPPPLGREDLIESARSAAAAYASGRPAAAGKDSMVGRGFSIHVPFGCDGPQASSSLAQAQVQYDAAGKTIRLEARPADWTTLPVMDGVVTEGGVEAIEGFWVPRPWDLSEACPPRVDAPPPATPTPPAAQTLGLASLFQAEGSRALRRDGRPYNLVRKLPEDDTALLVRRYRLVLEGRITGYPDGRAVRCRSESADHRPVCVFAVTLARVAFEDADSGQRLAEWVE